MKILHLSGAYVWGGNENQLVHFIHNTKSKAVENIIFCFIGSPIEKYAIENGKSRVDKNIGVENKTIKDKVVWAENGLDKYL